MSSLAQDGHISTRAVFQAIELGDAVAAQIVDRAIRLICVNLGAVVNLLDIKLIVMGGGVTKAAPWLVERVNQEIRPYLMTVEAQRDLRVRRESTTNAALWGAAAHVFATAGVLPTDLLEAGRTHRAIRAF